MSDELYELPGGWRWVKLGDVANYINGRAFKSSEWKKKGLPIIRIQNLTNEATPFNYFDGEVEDKHKVRNRDLLISWSATLGAFIWNRGNAVLNQHIFKVEPKVTVDKKYLFYCVEAFLDDLKRQVHGTGMQHITKGKFEKTSIPLPPLHEQKLIVQSIESAFARVEAAKKFLLESRKAIDKLVPAAVNKAIPTEDPLPDGWKWVKLGDVCEINPRDKLNGLKDDTEVTFVPMMAVDEIKGQIIEPQIRKLSQVRNGYTNFRNGDVIFAKITPCMENGKCAIARDLLNGIGFGSTEFHVLRPKNEILSEYVYLYLRQPFFRNGAQNSMTGTAGQLRVPTSFIKNAEIVLPSISEQKQIAEYIKSVSQRAWKLKELNQLALERVEKISSSILSKAFRGELVSYNGKEEAIKV